MIKKIYFLRALCGYCFILPCYFHHGIELRISQEAAYQLGSLALILLSMLVDNVRPLKFKGNIWILSFGILTLINYIYYNLYVGAGALLNIFLGILLYFRLSQILTKDDLKPIFRSIMYAGIIGLIYLCIQQFLNYDPIYKQLLSPELIKSFEAKGISIHRVEPVSFFGFKAGMAQFYAIIIPILAYFNVVIPLIICTFPLWIGVSTMSQIAAGFGFLYYLFWYQKDIASFTIKHITSLRYSRPMKKWYIWFLYFKKLKYTWFFILTLLLVPMGVTTYIVKIDNPMGLQTTRLTMWKEAWRIALMKPVLGWGLDSFRNVWQDKAVPTKSKMFGFYRIESEILSDKNVVIEDKMKISEEIADAKKAYWDNPHCELLQMVFEFGLSGLFIILLIVIALIKEFIYSVKTPALYAITGSLLCMIICGISQFPFHLARTVYLIPILLGLFIVYTSEDKIAPAIHYY